MTKSRARPDGRPLSLLSLSLAAVVLGLVTGVGAIFFRGLIGAVHNLLFLGRLSVFYDANAHTPASPWGIFVIVVPVIGAFAVTYLVNTFAPEARGHGVPEVMDAIYYHEGRIRPVVAIMKSLASALAIGSGSSVGREGPIIQIGASIGSTLGQLVSVASWQRITLVAAGAGAGIAATFNTPIGGVMFAIELMMPEISVRTFLPVALATGCATFVARLFLGLRPAFDVPPESVVAVHPVPLVTLILFALLGVIIGVAASGFVHGLHRTEEAFARVRNAYLRHAFGMLIVGVMLYALFQAFGHYYVGGVGYATIEDILLGRSELGFLLALLFCCKLVATLISLGSGSSGGIFSPSLFMGATLGAAFGALAHWLLPGAEISLPAFAIVGMAAMVGGATGAAMTAVTMIFEMTRDYDIVMPMIVAVALSIGVRRLLSRENIYTIKLVARRHFIPRALHANMFLVRRAADVMDKGFTLLPADTDLAAILKSFTRAIGFKHVIAVTGQRITGAIRINTALRQGLESAHAGVPLRDIAARNFTIAREDDIVFDVIARMSRRGSPLALVVRGTRRVPRPDDILGVITKDQIADSVAASVRLYNAGRYRSVNQTVW